MKQAILILLTITLLTSCISTKRFTGIVKSAFSNTKVSEENDNIIFDYSSLEKLTDSVISTELKSQFIPAVLYWHWNKSIKCEIDPKLIGLDFQNEFIRNADTLNLLKKLSGKRLEVQLERIPNSFVYTNKGNTIILIVGYIVSDLEAIFPSEQNLQITYKLVENGLASKTGTISMNHETQPQQNKIKSTKRFTLTYLDQFKLDNKKLAKKLTERLLTEL